MAVPGTSTLGSGVERDPRAGAPAGPVSVQAELLEPGQVPKAPTGASSEHLLRAPAQAHCQLRRPPGCKRAPRALSGTSKIAPRLLLFPREPGFVCKSS